MKYFIIEIQATEDTATVVTPIQSDSSIFAAESKYHQALAAAAISPVPYHSVVLLDSLGRAVKEPECYIHGGSGSEE